MGSISRALQNAGYLRPVVDSLNELIQRRKYEQGLQQLAEMLSGSENRMRDIYESKAYNTMEPSRTESNIDVDAKENLQPLGLDKVQKSSPLAYLSSVKPPERTPLPITDDKPVAPRIDIGQPEYEVLGDIKEGPKYTPQEQNRLAGQEINSFLRRLITSQNIPPEKIQLAGSLLQQWANTYKPEKRELMSVGKGADIIDTRTGERVYENLDEGKKNEYGWVTIGSGNKGGKKMVTQENKITGERRTVEVGEEDKPGGTTVNIVDKPIDIPQYIEKTHNTKGEIDEIDHILKGKPFSTEQGKKWYLYKGQTWDGAGLEAKKKNLETVLRGNSEAMIDYLEENRYPSVREITNEMWNDIKDKEPTKIRSYIENKVRNDIELSKLPTARQDDLINTLASYFQVRKY